MEEEEEAAGSAPPATRQRPGTACMTALMHRCSDKAPTVRGKAVGNLALLLSSSLDAVAVWTQQVSLGACSLADIA